MSLAASSELIAKPQQTTIYHSEMGQESSSSGVYKRCAKQTETNPGIITQATGSYADNYWVDWEWESCNYITFGEVAEFEKDEGN